MTEIELKAHVREIDAVERAIRSFASYSGETIKRDTYFRLPRSGGQPDGTGLAALMAIFTFVAALAAAICVIAGASKTVAVLICLFATAFVAASTIVGARQKKTGSYGGATGQPIKVRIREEGGVTTVTYKKKEVRGRAEVNDEREFRIDNRMPLESLLGDLGFLPDSAKEKRTKSWTCATPEGFDATIELSLVGPLGWFVEIEILKDEPDETEIKRATEALGGILSRCGVDEREIETRYYTEMLADLEPAFSHEPKK